MNNTTPLAELRNVSVKQNNQLILDDINLSIGVNEQWAIIGKSGSGKTTLAHVLTGSVFHAGTVAFHLPETLQHQHSILLIEQQHRFKNLSNTNDFYYQQRFNSSDADNAITVEQAFNEYRNGDVSEEKIKYCIDLLHLDSVLQEPLIQLSNGENKRLQIAKALLSDPAVLIMDNPFTGLDTDGRKILHSIFDSITTNGIHVILITSADELPGSITHVAVLQKGRLISKGKKEEYHPVVTTNQEVTTALSAAQLNKINSPAYHAFSDAIKMVDVSINYGNKVILENINWHVKKGECWSISGPNGAGKSTLLSLINADNPQAYANEIYLFDKRRGRGESIWDIKRLIGYVSPELHLFFEQYSACYDVVASGLFDTIGLFRQLNESQSKLVDNWLELLNLVQLKHKPLFQLSLGEQRMVLLARALVKNPALLILDEPCQGLDEEQSAYFKNLVDQLCRHFKTTLLYVSHYEKDIPSCVNHYLRLKNGKRII
ncbi:MAG: ATP-binding cassette domain-containing protein [Bacteroidota bacterium]